MSEFTCVPLTITESQIDFKLFFAKTYYIVYCSHFYIFHLLHAICYGMIIYTGVTIKVSTTLKVGSTDQNNEKSSNKRSANDPLSNYGHYNF